MKVKLFADSFPIKVRLRIILPNDSAYPGKSLVSQVFEIDIKPKSNTLEWNVGYFGITFPKQGLFIAVSDANDSNFNKYKSFGLLCTTQVDENFTVERTNGKDWAKTKPFYFKKEENSKWWNGKINLVLKNKN